MPSITINHDVLSKLFQLNSFEIPAGLEMVLAGVVLPLIYFGSTIMFFSTPQTIPTIFVTACSTLCIALGIGIFVRNR